MILLLKVEGHDSLLTFDLYLKLDLCILYIHTHSMHVLNCCHSVSTRRCSELGTRKRSQL